jgi:hypothetical protein
MRRRGKALTAEQIKDEVRKLSRIERSAFHRSFYEEAAVDLILKIVAPAALAEAQRMAAADILPVISLDMREVDLLISGPDSLCVPATDFPNENVNIPEP